MPDGSARSAAMPGRFGALRENYPVVIVGGGINGCGLFRDLCEQGLDVLLIERTDFCSGASAAPSRLIHGGIKYLETGEFRLVGQSARERNLLLKNAPHYVTALETVLPVASHFGGIVPSIKRFLGFKARMSDRGSIITRLGLLVYDLYGRHFRTMPKHRMLSARRARAEMPSLNPTFVGVGLYYEARISHAERLGLELVLDGEAANPASRGLNHAEIRLEAGRLEIMDRLTGERRAIEARIVVNAGGAWADDIARMAGARPVGLIPKRRTVFVFTPPSDIDVRTWPLVIGARENFYFKPDAGNLLVSPADETPSRPMDAQAEELDVAIAADRLMSATSLEVRHIQHRWAGLRTFTADKTPVSGFDPEIEGFLWHAGQGGYGFQTAPGMGSYTAALAMGKPIPANLQDLGLTDQALSPARFVAKNQDAAPGGRAVAGE